MKPQDAQLLAAAARAFAEASTSRVAGPANGLTAAEAEGWLELLRGGVPAASRGFAFEAPPAPAPAPDQSPGDGQLLAAAHAVAAYWLSASRAALVECASGIVSNSGQAITIRVSHVTPEGGLAAVELAHPDLGALTIEVSLSGRTLSVLATAENEHAAAAIRAGQAALAQRLREQGITLQTLQVVVLRRRGRTDDTQSKRQES